MENEPMPSWADVLDSTLEARSRRLADNIIKSNTLLERAIEWQKTLPPPTLAERLRSRISQARMWLGSKIAGLDLSEPDWLDD